MRIVAGTFRGRLLVAPKAGAVRPTADRARQALFDVLEHAPWSPRLMGARVIDLFAGSGALGLEAVSRGAAFCLFIERAAGAHSAILRNIAALGVAAATKVELADATRLRPLAPSDGAAFEVALLDPPYGQGLGEAALASLRAGGWLAPGAIVALETGLGEAAAPRLGFERLDERAWGAAQITFLRVGP